MKKTLLAAVIAASFGVTAAHAANLPAYTDAGSPISFVLSGNVDLLADGSYTNISFGKTSVGFNTLGYEVDTLKLAFDVSSPFMGVYTAAGHIDLKQGDNGLALGKYFVSFGSDSMGTVSIGNQASASDDLAYNGFDSYDILPPAQGNALNSPALSIKYTSPEFSGVTVAASLAATSEGVSYSTKNNSDSASHFNVNFLSLAAQYAQDNLTVAATVDLSKDLMSDKWEKVAGRKHGVVAATLGAGYTFDNVTVFSNIGYSTRDAASFKLGDALDPLKTAIDNAASKKNEAAVKAMDDQFDILTKAPADDIRLAMFGGQLGASVDVSDADNVKVALQAGTIYTNEKDSGSLYMFGVKAAASHSFNDNFSVGAFVTYNHLGIHQKDAKDLPSLNFVKYGLAVSYDF